MIPARERHIGVPTAVTTWPVVVRGPQPPLSSLNVPAHAAPGDARFVLLIFHELDGTVESRPLPAAGVLTIGRADTSDLVLHDAAVSRQHALLHIGETIEVEDLGSGNGTRLFDWRKTPARASDETERTTMSDARVPAHRRLEVSPGHVVQIGSAVLVVQRAASPAVLRRVWPHDYFEARVAEECARAVRHKGSFVVIGIQLSGDFDAPLAERVIGEQLAPEDVLALHSTGNYEVLVVDPQVEHGSRIFEALKGAGMSARITVARHPPDGRSADALIARALGHAEPEEPGSGRPVLVDPAMQRLYRLAERVAVSTIPVLILGDTGVGKELLAETLHRRSPRRAAPFVRLNCAALSESLLESELFGHERGAFTGAAGSKPGLLETASGGTLFLDEIGELPLQVQAKLLRVLEDQSVLRVGATKTRQIDVRFVAATNRDLESEVQAGRFRGDLFFRISGVSLLIPPLRDRPAEIEVLTKHFVREACRREGRSPEPTMTEEAMSLLRGYGWPGNVRELKNVVERALLLCTGTAIRPEHLPVDKLRAMRFAPAPIAQGSGAQTLPPPRPLEASPDELRAILAAAEREEIIRALDTCAGNQTRAAKLLGIGRRTLIARMDAYGLPRPRK
jgi:two-component system, NtrC family, response regulator AtoC